MAEYFVGKDQMLDGNWLDYLSAKFENIKSQKSALAFKQVVEDLLLSETFSVRNPDPDKCYGNKPPERTTSDLPCEIAYILKKNCVSCHGDGNVNGGLNLEIYSSWQNNGREYEGFLHTQQSQRILPKETLTKILSSLSTNDPNQLMPLEQEMPDSQRRTLYKWTEKMLAREK